MSIRILAWVVPAAFLGACTTTVTTFEGAGGSGGGSSSSSSSSSSNNTSSSSSSSSSAGGGGGGLGFGACERSYECVLRVPGCCGVCGQPTLADVQPINEARSADFFEATCTEEEPICPDCAEGYNPNLFAFCEAGQCAEADVLAEPWNQCQIDDDCMLRVGTDCCESCTLGGYDNLIAVPVGSNGLGDKVCDDEPSTCPPCVPTYPAEAHALCNGGVCQVGWTN